MKIRLKRAGYCSRYSLRKQVVEPVFERDLDFALFYAEMEDLLKMKNGAT